jgi:hypothetical protein
MDFAGSEIEIHFIEGGNAREALRDVRQTQNWSHVSPQSFSAAGGFRMAAATLTVKSREAASGAWWEAAKESIA